MRAVLPALILSVVTSIVAGCLSVGSIEELTGPAQGSTYHIKYVRHSSAPSPEQLKVAVQDVLDTVDRQVSTYRPDSDIQHFNALASNQCMPIKDEMASMLNYAFILGQQSGGAYDITLLPLLRAWGFAPSSNTQELPNLVDIAKAKHNTGWAHLSLRNNQLCKANAAVEIDLNSLAAGFTVDRIARRFDELGISSYFIEVTGETFAKGYKPNGSAWQVALEQPNLEGKQIIAKILPLNNLAVATSGDYRNYKTLQGRRYSHIIDPRSASPITHNTATVVSNATMQADAQATLLLILGQEEGLKFAEQHAIAALFIVRDQQEFVIQTTRAFDAMFAQGELHE
ncbi:FAD:protein FMN transferase [Pseudomonas sp. F1_0610]|uniref:FAD:protein FMN transferase n=1 Tax=Pseudomonas sp. F1_0610 TaxID=3114284 RepID=UPI0039C17AFC